MELKNIKRCIYKAFFLSLPLWGGVGGGLCVSSCFHDETTLGDGPISEITIDFTSVQEYYDINKNEVLTISPVVSQSYKEKPLSYTWEVADKVYSTAPVLQYKGDRLGMFQCRLVIENEDGKAFHPFVISVNSPYEEGYTVLSCDENGRSMLSFMLTQYADGVVEHFDEGDCFEVNNPDEPFAAYASDMVQCNKNLIISCKGNDKQPGTIYYLNDKTFVIENKLEAPEYPDFRPVTLGIPGTGSVGCAYPIICENGKVYEFSTSEGALMPADNFRSTYATRASVYTDKAPGYFSIFMWDKEVGGLCMLYNAYGPFYCGSDYLLERQDCSGKKNYFDGLDFVTMFSPRVPERSSEQPALVVLMRNKAMTQKVILDGVFFWDRDDEGNYRVKDNGGKQVAGFGEPVIDENTPIIASRFYYACFYAKGNKVHRWNYTTSQRLDQSIAQEYFSVGSPDAVITCMELSRDQTELYVAFYEPNESGLNGHVWVYLTDDGELLRQYDNISYRPVKIMYKKK